MTRQGRIDGEDTVRVKVVNAGWGRVREAKMECEDLGVINNEPSCHPVARTATDDVMKQVTLPQKEAHKAERKEEVADTRCIARGCSALQGALTLSFIRKIL